MTFETFTCLFLNHKFKSKIPQDKHFKSLRGGTPPDVLLDVSVLGFFIKTTKIHLRLSSLFWTKCWLQCWIMYSAKSVFTPEKYRTKTAIFIRTRKNCSAGCSVEKRSCKNKNKSQVLNLISSVNCVICFQFGNTWKVTLEGLHFKQFLLKIEFKNLI